VAPINKNPRVVTAPTPKQGQQQQLLTAANSWPDRKISPSVSDIVTFRKLCLLRRSLEQPVRDFIGTDKHRGLRKRSHSGLWSRSARATWWCKDNDTGSSQRPARGFSSFWMDKSVGEINPTTTYSTTGLWWLEPEWKRKTKLC